MMLEFTPEELIGYAKENLTRSIQEQVGEFFGERWGSYVEYADNSDDPRNMIVDLVDNMDWMENKIRIKSKMEDLRLLILFKVDLSLHDGSDGGPDDVDMYARVQPHIAVEVEPKNEPSIDWKQFSPIGETLHGDAHLTVPQGSRKRAEMKRDEKKE